MILSFRMPSERFRKAAKLVIKIIITALCAWYLSYKIDLKKISGILTIAQMSWMLMAVCAFMFSKMLAAFRLNVYFRSIGIRLPEWKNIQLYWLGMSYNLLLPGSIGGDVYKVMRLTKEYQVPYKKTTAAVLLDRISGLLALGVLLGIFWVIAFKGGFYSSWLLAGIALSIPILYLLIKIFFPYFLPVFFRTFAWGMAVQVFQVLCMYCVLRSLQINKQEEAYLLVFLISSVVAVLPFTVGGLGAREVVFLWGAQWFGLDNTVSVMASILFYGTTLASSLPGLLFIFIDPLKTDQRSAHASYATTKE